MEDYRQIEMNLICGIMDAIPNPTVLLNRDGQFAYANPLAEALPVSPDSIDYGAIPAVRRAIDEGKACPGMNTVLGGGIAGGGVDGGGTSLAGFLQIYPIAQDGAVAGALLFFQPDEDTGAADDSTPSRLPYVSGAIAQVWERIGRLSGINAGVLFIGETGVGRESFARALHERSGRRHLPFVAVDCRPPAVTAEGGAKTSGFDALFNDPALCRQAAEAGMCCFDGIDALSNQDQARLLDCIRQKKIGGSEITARLCYTAHPSVDELAARGEFSSELMTRVSLMRIVIPPLRERPDDIPVLARHYLKKHAGLCGKPVKDFTEEVWRQLIKRDWPLNLRDMDALIGESVLAADGEMVAVNDVPFAATQQVSLRRARHRFTYARIDALLAVYGNTTEGKRRAAQELGIGLSTLYRLLAKQTREKKRGEI